MFEATRKIEIMIPGGKITNAIVLEDGTCELTIFSSLISDAITTKKNGKYQLLIKTREEKGPNIHTETCENSETKRNQDLFVLVEASKLRLKDDFLQFDPETEGEEKLKNRLIEVIKKGVKDFWRPICDPSFNEDETGICFVVGKTPAVAKSYSWWEKAAREFCPERKSRLFTEPEYVAFLGVFIKKLIESGLKTEEAWYTVCSNSNEIGHYCDSKNAKHLFEETGSRGICGFYDLGNTYKILAGSEEWSDCYWLVGGYWLNSGAYNPIAKCSPCFIRDYSDYEKSRYSDAALNLYYQAGALNFASGLILLEK